MNVPFSPLNVPFSPPVIEAVADSQQGCVKLPSSVSYPIRPTTFVGRGPNWKSQLKNDGSRPWEFMLQIVAKLLALIFVLLLIALLGARLLYAGRKQRVGNDPHCAKCDYLLIGLPNSSRGLPVQRCPECGEILLLANVVYGEPRRNWRIFTAGWVLLIGVVILFCCTGVASLQDVDWYQYKPAHFVLNDLNSGKLADQQRSWKELTRRESAGTLSATARDQMVKFALNLAAGNPQKRSPLATTAVEYLGDRCMAHNLPAEQVEKFFDLCVQTTLAVRPIVIVGDSVPCMVRQDMFGPSNNNHFYVNCLLENEVIDDQQIIKSASHVGEYTLNGGVGEGYLEEMLPCPPPGKHTLSLTERIDVYSGPCFRPALGKLECQILRTMTADFTVLAQKPANLMVGVNDPKLASAMASAIQSARFHYEAQLNNQTQCIFEIHNPPVGIAADVLVRYDGKESPQGQIMCPFFPGAGYAGFYRLTVDVKDLTGNAVDIILRPNEALARQTVDIYHYWNREIVISNVPVKRD